MDRNDNRQNKARAQIFFSKKRLAGPKQSEFLDDLFYAPGSSLGRSKGRFKFGSIGKTKLEVSSYKSKFILSSHCYVSHPWKSLVSTFFNDL